LQFHTGYLGTRFFIDFFHDMNIVFLHLFVIVVVLIVVVLIYVLMMIFAGFLIELATVFKWLSWIRWISAFRYASNVLTINEFQGLKLCLANQTSICPMTGENVLYHRGIAHGTAWDIWKNFFALTMMATILFILAYIRLLKSKKTK
jgi:ATP-binding cassette subfamily G (WHITE) protein 2